MTLLPRRTFLSLLAVSALAGCAAPTSIKSYEGPALTAGDTAVLQVDRTLYVSKIDGRPTGIDFTVKEKSMEGTQFELKEGQQEIVFSYYLFTSRSDNVGVPPPGTVVTTTYSSSTFGPFKLSHDFKKGHKHEVHYEIENEKEFYAKIVDVTAGGAKRGYAVAWGRF